MLNVNFAEVKKNARRRIYSFKEGESEEQMLRRAKRALTREFGKEEAALCMAEFYAIYRRGFDKTVELVATGARLDPLADKVNQLEIDNATSAYCVLSKQGEQIVYATERLATLIAELTDERKQ
jgi:hypothetical protein